ncbi:hypothetical protein NQ314_011431 [Rhamnusium bicolor]|uniref:Epoxide hydrolase N-terminal domain-containing protein n=1 Tax=Rhamnusium bicolor TaxID=1586634 RepID=A0AAV8XJ47_9CUCU|nr:hypothetical protein NQ314_011431 [Rhamnusium bicolor]
MGLKFLLAIPVLIFAIGYKLNSLFEPPPLPKLEEDTWWGLGPRNDTMYEKLILEPFNITVHEQYLVGWRLATHRPLTPPLEGIQQQYGMNTNLLRDIVNYWGSTYNWTERQEYLNQYPQYHVFVQGLGIHVVHVNPKIELGIKIVPLLLLHGWPGCVREFFELIPKLTTPQEGRKYMFEVIIPHIPGEE